MVASERLLDEALEMVGVFAKMHAPMLLRYKRTVDTGFGMPLKEACEFEVKEAFHYYKHEMPPELFDNMRKFLAMRSKQKKGKAGRAKL